MSAPQVSSALIVIEAGAHVLALERAEQGEDMLKLAPWATSTV